MTFKYKLKEQGMIYDWIECVKTIKKWVTFMSMVMFSLRFANLQTRT